MGEVVVSSEGGMELEVRETEIAEKQSKKQKILADGGDAAEVEVATADTSVVKWEKFLPKMVVRVLLVEADDSTRQIIAALLRKCSYRVAAVSDGLKAWEVLKGSPCNIDLILTEVELPSISGYALLTLIMEHEVCKNIPVIMMSSQDSVSTVYKCMLRGATDFLVKPVRKNELRNLWQHVWRKQASSTSAGLGPPDESVQQKDETTAENNAIKSETEGEDIEHGHCLSQPKSAKCLSDDINNITKQEERHQESRKKRARDNETEDADYEMTREDKNSNDGWEKVNAFEPKVENTHVFENSSREAIDLIGAFDNHLKGTFGSSALNVSTNKFDSLPLLDLSLRRPHPSGSEDQVNDERPRLNHSDASPFSRYINKPLLIRKPTSPVTSDQQNPEKQQSIYAPDYSSDTRGPPSTHTHIPTATNQTGQPEMTFSYARNREISHPIPVRGVRFENVINGYGSVMPSTYCAQSGSSPMSSPPTAQHTESFPQMNPFYSSDHQRISSSIGQTENKQGEKSENVEDQGRISPGNDQSGNSSFCNGNKSDYQNGGSGSYENIYTVSVIKAPSECGNDESFHVHEGASERSMRREAALTKFRLKRKDRCFEKKVRYESRKKLAEQRPRVKGQFVRQAPNDPQPGNSSAS
ncbi:hypothetical protein DH2020_009731 [Rehmannia glutinosa]|uniref:Two-component response regulator-like protein n=1 Tax=Rehmannia glutinosa TaxID=99300 RepID=A0ABR0X761_REHGL